MEPLIKDYVNNRNYRLTIRIFEQFVEVEILLSNEIYYKIVENSFDITDERLRIRSFLENIFTEKQKDKYLFCDEEDNINWYKKLNIEKLYHDNLWFKTMVFMIDRDNYEESLKIILSYIKVSHDNYTKKLSPDYKEIADKLTKDILKNNKNGK